MASKPPIVNVITPATDVGLISLADAKILLGIPAADVSGDAQLQMLIDQNSMQLALQANRDTFALEQVEELWDCLAAECCHGATDIYLTRYPVKTADIELVETPQGTAITPADWILQESVGLLRVPLAVDQVFIRYSGGYDLPEEAPLPLQQACGLMVRQFRTQAAQESTAGSGVRLIAHKESRIMYFSPKDMAGGSSSSSGGGPTVSASDAAIKNLIAKYTRLWI